MTAITEIATASMSEVSRIGAEIVALQEEAKRKRQEAMKPFLEALAASGAVSIIVIKGYTPGFNDGEPCEHSADFYVNVEQIMDNDLHEDGDLGFELPEEILDGIQTDDAWNSTTRTYEEIPEAAEHNRALCRAHGHVYSPPGEEVMKAISALIFETAEEDYNTDYYITYVLKDGKFEVTNGDYDCGY
jgi:hypothetical protein